MKTQKFSLILGGIFSLFLVSIFIVSCSKQEATPIEVVVPIEDNSKISIDDADVQKFRRIMKQYSDHLYSLGEDQVDKIVAIPESKVPLSSEEILAMHKMSEAEADQFTNGLTTIQYNLHEKYPYLGLGDMEFAHYVVKVGRMYPIENNQRVDWCKHYCEVLSTMGALHCHKAPHWAAKLACYAVAAVGGVCCSKFCDGKFTEFNGSGTGTGSGSGSGSACEACGCGSGSGSGSGSGNGSGSGSGSGGN